MKLIHTKFQIVAAAFGPFVITGQGFWNYPDDEQLGILAHEQGHIEHRHGWDRPWMLLNWFLFKKKRSTIRARCMAQEYEADEFVVACGYAQGFLHYLKRLKPGTGELHPSPANRIDHILKMMA